MNAQTKPLLAADDPFLQPLLLGPHQFPGIWRAILPAGVQQLHFPEERRSSCMNCPKACLEGYRADYRCCTYHPRIGSFLLGLAQETPAGAQAVTTLLQRGMLLPEGMLAAPNQWLDFVADQADDAYGRSTKVLCPLLDQANGQCSVHPFRNAVCATFFCLHDHGQAGESFWAQLQTLGSQVEMSLTQWSLRQVGFDLDAYFQRLDALAPRVAEVSGPQGWNAKALGFLWGAWAGRERELLRACAEVVLAQRDQLWTLAQTQVVQEASLFDEALQALVPADEGAEAEDYDEDEVLSDAALSWEKCLEAHARLWQWPTGRFRLSPKVVFVANLRQNPEAIYYSAADYFIEYQLYGSEEPPAWTLPLSQNQKSLLELFLGEGQLLNAELLATKEAQAVKRAEDFISEMLQKKVLWPFK